LPADEDALTRAIIALASEYGRYGYRRITARAAAGGRWARIRASGSGVVRGSRSRRSTDRAEAYG